MIIYPSDANGDALRRMAENGDDLSKSRNVDFSVVFADRKSAERFAEHFRGLGNEVVLESTKTDRDGFPWDVTVVQHMVPSMMGSVVSKACCNP